MRNEIYKGWYFQTNDSTGESHWRYYPEPTRIWQGFTVSINMEDRLVWLYTNPDMRASTAVVDLPAAVGDDELKAKAWAIAQWRMTT